MSEFKASGVNFGMDLEFWGQYEGVIRCFWFYTGKFKWSDVTGVELGTSAFLLDPSA